MVGAVSWLIADIGGTHARFACCDAAGRQHDLLTLNTADYDGLEAAVVHYFQRLKRAPARRLILALPCPVERDPIVLTNAGWRIERSRLNHSLELQALTVVNDFYAQAMALPHLQAQDLYCIHAGDGGDGNSNRNRNRVVLGPGTGLGVAALVQHAGIPVPVTGEGGHVTLAAADDYEDEILRAARRANGHVSAEKLVSGIGLSALEQCMAQVAGDRDYQARASRDIVNAASAGEARALATVQQMLAFLATVAADLALNFGAFGGVYLSGGILPRLRTVVDWPAFHQRFVDKGRFHAYLQRIPVHLVTHEQPGLLGLAVMIRHAEQA